jgi:hypothetical protein
MGNITKILNKYLIAKFDVKHPIYKALVANEDNIIPPDPQNPSELDIGAIANDIEWLRLLSKGLLNQLDWNKASTKYLNLTFHKHLGIVRYEGENDTGYVARVVNFIIAPKVSETAIRKYTIPYSSPGLPEIITGGETAFADVTFSDNYTEFQNQTPGSPEFNHYIFPAIATNGFEAAYFLILQLQNTDPDKINEVVDIVNRWIAGGIRYEIQIVSVP